MPAEVLHLTLVFLGPTEPDRVPAMSTSIEGVAAGRSAYRTTITGAGGHISDRRSARRGGVAWLTLRDGFDETASLSVEIDTALASATFDARRRPRPHLTVARNVDVHALAALRSHASALNVEWTTSRLVLFRSHLGARGSRYEELAAFELHA